MKKYLSYIVKSILFVALIAGCKTKDLVQSGNQTDKDINLSTSQLNLGYPINTPTAEELSIANYNESYYYLLEDSAFQFKDNAPFIEFIDGGKKERLWFASSRLDPFYGNKHTNHYQQIYYTERTIGEGKCPSEGWGPVTRFKVEPEHSLMADFIKLFNSAVKGAPTMAGNILVFACDQIDETKMTLSELKDLWLVERNADGKFSTPKVIESLSSEFTWESQPTLSPNGKHLLFVSNRNLQKMSNDPVQNNLNIFYSFFNGDNWSDPVVVSELNSSSMDITPRISMLGNKVYFSSNRNGKYAIYEAPIVFNDQTGGYKINGEVKAFDAPLLDVCTGAEKLTTIVDGSDQQYPLYYYNKYNKKVPQAFFWSSNHEDGNEGTIDIYGCNMPFKINYHIVLEDVCSIGEPTVLEPVIEIKGNTAEIIDSSSARFQLYSGLKYKVNGGSFAKSFFCDIDSSFVMIGYSKIKNQNPNQQYVHSTPMEGAEVSSFLTTKNGGLPTFGIYSDTILFDTIQITKAWEKKEKCPMAEEVPRKHEKIAYFQTGYWEVNTTANLKRDLARLHEGFDTKVTEDYYNPLEGFVRNKSDYTYYSWGLNFPVLPKDGYKYSIANARWIELHPNNQYWGDHPGYTSRVKERMDGRRNRIKQYQDYAEKVDDNLNFLAERIDKEYIKMLMKNKDYKPQLLIEIFAVSDEREVTRGWYIGDTVEYRASKYVESKDGFTTEPVKIIPPIIDEKNKEIKSIKACSIDLNEDGDNGSMLGISAQRTDANTNLSKLRAWFGYKEVFEHLKSIPEFMELLEIGRVALPDNEIPYDYGESDIVIVTQGRRIEDILNPKRPYPEANNPSGNGYFDYDDIRRIEVKIKLRYPDDRRIIRKFCCDPTP